MTVWGNAQTKPYVWYRTQVMYCFPQNSLVGNPRIHVQQSAVIQEVSADTSWRVCKHFTKNARTPHEESMDISRRVCGIAKKFLQIKCCEFAWLAPWKLLGLFLSATTTSDLGNRWSLQLRLATLQVNRFASRQRIIHWCVDRARTFCKQSMDVLQLTVHHMLYYY